MLENDFTRASRSNPPKIVQDIFRGGVSTLENYNSTIKRSIHCFDSGSAKAYSSGFLYRYVNSNYKVCAYRIIGILVAGLSGPRLSVPVWYICSSLNRAEYTGHRNGVPLSVVAVLLNPSGVANPSYFDLSAQPVPVQPETMNSIELSLKDDQLNPITDLRFIVIIEFIHSIV